MFGISKYSYCGSKLVLVLPDFVAKGYNRCVSAFMFAQTIFEIKNKRTITQREIFEGKLIVHAKLLDAWCYNLVCKIVNQKFDSGYILRDDECTDDDLVKI